MHIEQTIVRIETDPASVSLICEKLGKLFDGEAAEIFVPYRPVPLNARIALPQPNELLVRLVDADKIKVFIEAFRDHDLSRRDGMKLTILTNEHRDTSDADAVLEELQTMVSSDLE